MICEYLSQIEHFCLTFLKTADKIEIQEVFIHSCLKLVCFLEKEVKRSQKINKEDKKNSNSNLAKILKIFLNKLLEIMVKVFEFANFEKRDISDNNQTSLGYNFLLFLYKLFNENKPQNNNMDLGIFHKEISKNSSINATHINLKMFNQEYYLKFIHCLSKKVKKIYFLEVLNDIVISRYDLKKIIGVYQSQKIGTVDIIYTVKL